MLLTAQLFMIDWFSEPGPHLSISIDYFLPWLCATFKQHLFHVEESGLKKNCFHIHRAALQQKRTRKEQEKNKKRTRKEQEKNQKRTRKEPEKNKKIK